MFFAGWVHDLIHGWRVRTRHFFRLAAKNRRWTSIKKEHEGLPLLLRFPVGINDESIKKHYPRLVAVTLTLKEVHSDGLPTLEHHESIVELDVKMTRLFESTFSGTIVLVETFAGKRIFYSYVAPLVDVDTRVDAVRAEYPGVELSWDDNADPEWKFIHSYASDFGLER